MSVFSSRFAAAVAAVLLVAAAGRANAQCTTEATLACTFEIDPGMEPDSVCNTSMSASVTGTVNVLPTTMINDTMARCVRTSTLSYFASVPAGVQNSVKYVVTVASFDSSSTDGDDDAAVEILVGANSAPIVLGRLVAGTNAQLMPDLASVTPSTRSVNPQLPTGTAWPGLNYPFNGNAFCNSTFSYQVWDVSAYATSSQAITGVRIRDGTGRLSVHAVVVDTCTNAFSGIANDVSYFSSGSAFVDTATADDKDVISSSPAATLELCKRSCGATPGCISFVYVSTTCKLIRSHDGLKYSSSTSQFLGAPPVAAPRPLVAYSIDSSVPSQQQAKTVRPHMFAYASYDAFLLPRLGSDSDQVHVLHFSSLTNFAVGVAQSTAADYDVMSVSATTFQQCGRGGLPFYSASGSSGDCGIVRFCPLQTNPAAGDALTIALAMPSTGTSVTASCNTSDIRSMALVQYQGTLTRGEEYSYVVSGQVSLAAATETAREKHGATPSWVEQVDASLQTYRYLLTGTTPTSSAPDWRWTDSDNALRSSPLWCDITGPIGYNVVHNNQGESSADYDCGAYATLDAIVAACEASSACAGFTMNSNGTHDIPRCLKSTTTASSANSTAYTLYVKTMAQRPLMCSFPILRAPSATIHVTNALPGATAIIEADGVEVSRCRIGDLSFANGGDCASLATCYTGSIPSTATTLTVRFNVTAPYLRRCQRAVASVRAEFSEAVSFSAPAGCLSTIALSESNGCSIASVPATTCSTYAYTGIDIQGTSSPSYCDVSAASTAGAPAEATFLVAGAAANSRAVLTVLDLTGLSGRSRGISAEVYVTTADGSERRLGAAFTGTDLNVAHYTTVGLASRAPHPLCTDASLRDSAPAGGFQVFNVPTSVAAAGIASIRIRGEGVRVLAVATLAATCEAYPLARNTSFDAVYSDLLPGVTLFGATLRSFASSSVAECADACAAESRCNAWSTISSESGTFAQTCSVLTGANGFAAATRGFGAAGTKATVSTVSNFVAAGPRTSIHAFLRSTNVTSAAAFMLASGRSGLARVGYGQSNSIRVALADSGFGSDSGYALISPAGSQSCGRGYFTLARGSSTTACDQLTTCAPLGAQVQADGVLSVIPLGVSVPASCNSSLWGLVASDGTVSSTVSYTRASVQDFGVAVNSVPLTAGATEVDIYSIRLDDVAKSFVVYQSPLDGDATSIPTLSSTRTNALCEIHATNSYDVHPGYAGVSGVAYDCASVVSIPEAFAKCNSDTRCKAFATTTDDRLLCFYRGTGNTSDAARTLFIRRNEVTCTVRLSAPGNLKIQTSQVGVGRAEGEAIVRVNGQMFRVCGGISPFTSGFSSSGTDCTVFRTCVDDIVTATTSEVTVSMPAVERGTCDFAHRVLFEFTPARSESLPFYSALSLMPQSRVVRLSGTTTGVSATLRTAGATRVAVLVQQDRYSCLGGCNVNFAVNLSIGTTVAARCGGVLGFAEFRGLSDSCGTYLYCGSHSGTTAAPSPTQFAPSTSITVGLVDPTLFQSVSCGADSDFRVRVFTDGGILSASSGVSETRTLYGIRVPREEIGPDTNLLSLLPDDRKFVLLKEQFPAVDNASYVSNTLYPVKLNNDQLPAYAILPFDVVGTAETSKSFDVGTRAVCLIDQRFERTTNSRCRFAITGSSITVQVAQTSFAAFNQFVTISMGDFSVRCGGDDPFFGLEGVNDRCDTYYTCYDGVAYGSEVVVTFSAQVDGSTCPHRALAMATVGSGSAPADISCSGSTPFPCVPLGQCFALDDVCDGAVTCPDGSDEGSCTNWNLVMSGMRPSCSDSPDTLATSSTVLCEKFAAARGARTFTVSNAGCKVYDCLNFDNPQLVSTNNTEDQGARLYIQTSDPTVFQLCTDALHCSNNGRVLSETAPCQCSCEVQYIGDRCESIRDISLVDSVFVLFPRGSTLNSTVVSAVIAAVSQNVLDERTSVTVDSIRTSADSTAVELKLINSVTNAQSSDVGTVLSQPVASAIVAALSRYGAYRVTASSAVGNDVRVACDFTNISATANTCDRVANINETQSISVTVPAITFGAASQWVQIDMIAYDGAVTTLSCNNTDFVRTVNPLLDGPCAVSSQCTKIVDRVGAINVRIAVSPDINPTAQECTAGRVFESSILVSGYVTLPDAIIDTAAEYSTTRNGSLFLLSILLFILGSLALLHLIVWFFWMRNKFSSVKYLGPIAATLSFFLLLGGAIAYGFYLDSAESDFSHLLLIEEYRDASCASSEFAFIPSRASYVEVSEACKQLNVIGEAQGLEYFAAKIPNGTLDRVLVKRGGTLESCVTAGWQVYPFRQCVSQTDLFVNKPVADRLFMQFISLPKALVLSRVEAIREFNPPSLLTAQVTVAEVPTNELFEQSGSADRVFYTRASQLISGHRPTAPARVATTTHLLVEQTSGLSALVRGNESDPSRVRYEETFRSSRTLFSAPKTTVYDTVPFLTEASVTSLPTDTEVTRSFENVGTLFNGFLSGSALSEYSGADAFGDAAKYQGIEASRFDLGNVGDEFTVSFWMKSTTASRGVVFAVTDNWQSSTGQIPPIERLITLIENGAETTSWYNNDAEIYASVFINGFSRALSFVHTLNGELEVIDWDTNFIGVDRIFDGEWHFVALQFFEGKSNREVQLVVDGETSFTEEGWRQCLKLELKPVKRRTVGDSVLIFNSREESMRVGGLLVLGYANVGLFDFTVFESAMTIQELNRYGADGMDQYATIARSESITLGILLALLCVLIMLATVYEGWNHFFGVSTDIIVDSNKQRVDDAQHGAQTKGGLAASGGSTRGELLVQFINPVIGVSQSMALYLDAWRWPDNFVELYGTIYSALSLDLFDVIPDLPVLLAPAIQFGLAIVALFAMVILAVRDEEVYAQVIQAYRDRTRSADRAFTRRLELERPRPEYKWVYYDEDSDKQPLTAEQEDFLQRGLHDLITSSHRKAKNMRLHSRSILKFPGFGSGILLYERREGDIGIFFRVSHEAGLTEVDMTENVEHAQKDSITMTQVTFECVASNVLCPLHERRLLKSEMEGISCVHNESAYYRSVSCDPQAVMYQCPEDDCMYAVCEDCWKHGAGTADSALTGALSTLAEVKRKGVWKAVSTLVIIVGLIMYLPVTKNAMLILTCHPSFQCEFGACWSNPDMKYLIAVLLCIITVLFIGVGLILLQGTLLYRRQTSLLQELPVYQIIRRLNLPCRSNIVVMRKDYDEFLDVDESMLKALYSVFEFQHLLFGPIYLLYKAAIIISVVATSPRSLTQLTCVSFFEALFAIVLTAKSPYKNVFIEAVGRVSSLHQLALLSLTCLHRVDTADGNEGYGDQMVLAVLVYAACVVVIGIGILISPWLRKVCLRDSVEEQLEKELAEEDERIAKEKEERRLAREKQLDAEFGKNGAEM